MCWFVYRTGRLRFAPRTRGLLLAVAPRLGVPGSSTAPRQPSPQMIFSRHRMLCAGLWLALAPVVGSATAAMETAKLEWKQLPVLPDQEGFASAFAGVSHGALLVAGGANFPGKRPWEGGTKVWYDEIFVLESPDAAWRVGGRLPRANAYGVSFTTAQGVVCAGGDDAREHWREVFLLNWDGRQVRTRTLPSLPTPLAFGSGASSGNEVYLFGGLVRPDATSASPAFLRLNLSAANPAWEELPPCPGPARMLAQVGVVNGRFYVCGGVTLHAGPDGKAVRSYLKDAYVYSSSSGWQQIADLPHTLAAAPSPMPVTPAGELLVVSGDDGQRGHLVGPDHPGFPLETLAYHPAHNTWRKLADVPFSRATAPTTPWEDAWVVASGERKPGYRSNEVWLLRFPR